MRSISSTKLMDWFRPPTAIVQIELSKPAFIFFGSKRIVVKGWRQDAPFGGL